MVYIRNSVVLSIKTGNRGKLPKVPAVLTLSKDNPLSRQERDQLFDRPRQILKKVFFKTSHLDLPSD